MKYTKPIFFLALLSASCLRPALAQERGEAQYVHVPVNVSFVPGISIGDMMTDGMEDPRVVNGLSLNLFAGYAYRLEGVEFGGIWNGYRESVRGVQYAGVANTNGQDLQGIQFAGIANVVVGAALGAQFAGVTNLVRGATTGVQFAGVVNAIGAPSTGVQFAGVANLTDGPFTGGQFAGVVNAVRGDVGVIQTAGVVNVVGGALSGVQIAGVVNVARDVTGVQIGLVNVSETNTGVPIGLVSYVGDVGLRFDVWAEETGFVYAAARSGNRRVANFFGVGTRPAGNEDGRFGIVAGLGYEAPLSRRAFLTVDGLTSNVFSDDFDDGDNLLVRLRLTAGFRPSDYVAVFAGPSLNFFVSDDMDAETFAPYTPLTSFREGDYTGALWAGFSAGLRIYTQP